MLTSYASPSSKLRLLALILASLAFFVVAMPQDAHAQRVKRNFKDKIHVVQPKPVLQKERFELAPRFGASVNDSVYQSFKLGVQGNYHIAESFFIGLMFDWYDFGGTLGGPTSTYESVSNDAGASADAAVVQYSGGLEFGWRPIWGKFSFFNSAVIYYDFALTVGGQWISAESLEVPGATGKPGGTVGLNSRMFLSKWVALNVGIRDLIFLQDLNGVSGALTNLVTVEGGISFYFPTGFEYSEKVADAPSN